MCGQEPETEKPENGNMIVTLGSIRGEAQLPVG